MLLTFDVNIETSYERQKWNFKTSYTQSLKIKSDVYDFNDVLIR